MKSGKAVTDRKAKEALKQLDDAYRRKAKEMYHDEGTCEIDDAAVVSINTDDEDGDGAYVQAWVYVRQSEAFPEPEEDE